jgi:hypothetical protein
VRHESEQDEAAAMSISFQAEHIELRELGLAPALVSIAQVGTTDYSMTKQDSSRKNSKQQIAIGINRVPGEDIMIDSSSELFGHEHMVS